MKKRVVGLIGIIFLVGLIGIVASDAIDRTMNISVEIKESVLEVEISKSNINLGETSAGYQTDIENFTITNLGNTKLYISASVEESAQLFENYLKLNRHANCHSTGWKNVSNFDLTLERPIEYGGQGTPHQVCVKLDLREYSEPMIEAQTINEELTFWIGSI